MCQNDDMFDLKCYTFFSDPLTLRYDIPGCVSQNHKIKKQTLESQNTTILYYIILYYIILYYIILYYIHTANDGNR